MSRDVDLSQVFPLERLIRRHPRAAFACVLVMLVLCSSWVPQ